MFWKTLILRLLERDIRDSPPMLTTPKLRGFVLGVLFLLAFTELVILGITSASDLSRCSLTPPALIEWAVDQASSSMGITD